VSGRGGSGSFGAAAAPLGMPSGKVGHHPGWKPLQGSAATMSQAGLQALAGSPDPLRGTCKSPSGSHRRDCNEHPLPSARKCVRGGVCGRVLGASSWGPILSSWFLCVGPSVPVPAAPDVRRHARSLRTSGGTPQLTASGASGESYRCTNEQRYYGMKQGSTCVSETTAQLRLLLRPRFYCSLPRAPPPQAYPSGLPSRRVGPPRASRRVPRTTTSRVELP
jgi:hypothetical protein